MQITIRSNVDGCGNLSHFFLTVINWRFGAQILGALSAIQSLAGGLGPFLFSALFTWSLKPGAPLAPASIWYVGIVIMAFALMLAVTVPASQSQLKRLRAHQDACATAIKAGKDPPPPLSELDKYAEAGYRASWSARACDSLFFGGLLRWRAKKLGVGSVQ